MDIDELHTRLFNHTPFCCGEIQYLLHAFEEKRCDHEIENLFIAHQKISEIKCTSIDRSRLTSEIHLPVLCAYLEETVVACEKVLEQQKASPELTTQLSENRKDRKKIWHMFVDDMIFKCSRLDNTFEEKEAEIRDFYLDLNKNIGIHK